jgi:hypothetical protein
MPSRKTVVRRRSINYRYKGIGRTHSKQQYERQRALETKVDSVKAHFQKIIKRAERIIKNGKLRGSFPSIVTEIKSALKEMDSFVSSDKDLAKANIKHPLQRLANDRIHSFKDSLTAMNLILGFAKQEGISTRESLTLERDIENLRKVLGKSTQKEK